MKYCTIAIGDELLIGQVVDTNSGWIARHMVPLGFDALWTKVIADDARQIRQAIDEALSQCDLVLMTGGLGPTKDDITKPTLCDYFGGTLVFDAATAQNVEKVVAARHLNFEDREPRRGFHAVCGAERTHHVRLDKLKDEEGRGIERGV
ncbi:MAG: hypothetical protein II428_00140, partial [Muribaculaceae bacterium]|nr:hypothetical protein [Muribaculaceae bacterium]